MGGWLVGSLLRFACFGLLVVVWLLGSFLWHGSTVVESCQQSLTRYFERNIHRKCHMKSLPEADGIFTGWKAVYEFNAVNSTLGKETFNCHQVIRVLRSGATSFIHQLASIISPHPGSDPGWNQDRSKIKPRWPLGDCTRILHCTRCQCVSHLCASNVIR